MVDSVNRFTGFYDAQDEKVDEAVNDIVGDIQGTLTRRIKTRIADKAEANVDQAIAVNESINHSEGSRRRFLANLASRLDSGQQIAQALVEQGFGRGDASSIASTVDDLQADPSKLDQFLDPSKSTPRFDRAVQTLEDHYDDATADLQTMKDRISSDEHNPWNSGRKLLTDPNYKFAREAVFEDVGIDPDIADGAVDSSELDNGLGRLLNDATEDAQDAEDDEQLMITGIKMATAVGTAGMGGAAFGVASTALNSGIDISIAQQDLRSARGARDAGLTDAGQVNSAAAKRDAAVAGAVIDLALVGAGETSAYKDFADSTFGGNDAVQALAEEVAKKPASWALENSDKAIRDRLSGQ